MNSQEEHKSGLPLPEEPHAHVTDDEQDKWLESGKSLITAALFGLFGVGIIYFISQTVFLLVGIIFSGLLQKILISPHEAADLITSSLDLFVTPIRWALLLSEYLGLLLVIVLFIRRWHTRHVMRYVRLNGAPVIEIVLAMAGTIAIIPIGSFITSIVQTNYHIHSDMEEMITRIFTAHSLPEFLFLVFVVAVTPAICEEIFFRGYVQRTFERVIGAHSIVVAGILFGLFHFEPLGLLTLSLIGVWLGFVYFRSRSLLPNMAAHFTNNFVALYLAYRAPVMFGVDLQHDEQIPLQWVLAAMVILASIAWYYYHHTADRVSAA